MNTPKRGRPKTIPPQDRQITIQQAAELVSEHRKRFGRKGVTLGHIYNLIHENKLHRWGPPKLAILDKKEIEEIFGLVG